MATNKNSVRILFHLMKEVEDQVEARFYSSREFPANQADEAWFNERLEELEQLRRQLIKLGVNPRLCNYSWLTSGWVAADYWEEVLSF